MTVTPAYVLRRTHSFFHFTGDNQDLFISSLFASYFATHGSKSTTHRYITYPNSIPKQLIFLYADPNIPHCPPMLFADISALFNGYCLIPSKRTQFLHLLLEIIYKLPTEDQKMILVDPSEDVPTHNQLASIFTRLLWYVICNEHALASTGKVA